MYNFRYMDKRLLEIAENLERDRKQRKAGMIGTAIFLIAVPILFALWALSVMP
jgi:hypothetical protein